LRVQHIINSPLGRADGDIYNHYFNLVRQANPSQPVPPYFEKLIKPLMERQPMPLDDASDMDLDSEIEEMIEEREQGRQETKLGEEEPKTAAD
jgi:acyl-CoA oxidase